MNNGVLVRLFASATGIEPATKQLVAPKSIQQSILEILHDGVCGGHFGLKKTLSKLKLRFYWPGHYSVMLLTILSYINLNLSGQRPHAFFWLLLLSLSLSLSFN